MSGSPNEYYSVETGNRGSAKGRKAPLPGTSTNEMIDRVFREPFFRFLLFLTALWRNWYWAFPASLILGVALAAATYLYTDQQYTSEAWLRVQLQQPYIAFPTQHTPAEAMAIVQSTLQIIYSPPVMEIAWPRIAEKAQADGIDISDIMKKQDPQRWLANNVNVRQRSESPIHIVSFTTKDPRLSQLILESIIAGYFDTMAVDNKKRNDYLTPKLEEIARLKKNEIEALNTEYNRYSRQIAEMGGDLPSELNKTIVGTQTPLANQIIGLEAEIASLEIMIRLNRNVLSDESEVPDSEVEADVLSNPLIQELMTERIYLQDKLEKDSEKYPPESFFVVKTQKKLDDVENRIESARESLLPDMKLQWKARMRKLAHNDILQSQQNIELLKSQVKSLQDANIKQQAKDGDVAKIINDAVEALTKRNREEQVYATLMSRIDVLKTETYAQDQVDQISTANMPSYPDANRRLRMAMLSFLIGMALPLLLAWGRELSCPRFYHLSQFPMMFPGVSRETVAGLSRSGRETEMNKRQRQAFYFSVDEICNNLCFGQSFADSRTFLFSSVRSDDGQAQLALSVAEKIAQMKKKPVLLIDTHGGSPRLRNLVGVEGKAGLADVLNMRQGLNESIVRDSHQPNLYFLPDGPSSGDSSIDLFSDGKFEMLLKELRNHYGTIIISARPFERSSGSHVLCHFVDAVVLALRMYDTPRKNTERIYERFVEVGKPITSFLISGISAGKGQ